MARAVTRKKSSRRTRAAQAAKPRPRPARTVLTAPAATPSAKSTRKFPNAWRLLQRTYNFWRRHGRLLGIYLLVVFLLNLLLVHNFSLGAASLQNQLAQFFGSNAQGIAAAYQYILLVIVSLSTIWLLRQLLSDNPPARLRVRDAFYQGMYPLIPFVLVLLVLTLELIPLIIGSYIYGIVIQNGIAVGVIQAIIWLLVLLLGATVTCWLLATHFFALYIVTLPNMTPVRALRSAKQLSRGQRPNILRKSFVLLLVIVVLVTVLLIPIVLLLPKLTGLLLFALGVLALPFAHSYFYMMYRELLHE